MSDSANRKPQIEPKVDASGVREGFNEIKEAARDMATSVEQAGKKAGAGVDGIGDGAGKSSEKLDRATKSIIGSIERATARMQSGQKDAAAYYEALGNARGVKSDILKPYIDQLRAVEEAQRKAAGDKSFIDSLRAQADAIGKTRAQLLELKAAQLGLSEAAAPYIQKLKDAEKAATGSLDNVGLSAKQTAAALRGVPAQFTDIITSLQGGQAPLTVFLQQGGQLKDMFGGAGNAAKALGGYVAGLVNPFTIAAAAVIGLGVAYAKGSAEQQEFQKTLILTGNQAGVTASQLMDMAAAVRATGAGTQGRAAEVINLMAADSKIGAQNIQRFTAAILEMERAGGPAAEELVKQFASLSKTPLESALKLNETTGFLTKSVYEQIRALEQAGKTTEAAKVAQEAYARAMEQRAPELVKNLGFIEDAWRKIGIEAKDAWDRMLDVGRANTAESLRKKIADLYAKSYSVNPDSVAGRSYARELADLERKLEIAEKTEGLAAKEAKSRAESNELVRIKGEWDKAGLEYLSKAEKLERALNVARTEGQKLVEAGSISPEQYRARLAQVREGFADKGASKEANRDLETQKKLLAELAGLSGSFEKDWADLNKLRKDGLITTEQLEQAQRKLIAQQPIFKAQAKEEEEATKAKAKAQAEATREYERWVDAFEKSAGAADKSVQQMRDEEQAAIMAASGQLSLAQAIQMVAIARLEEQRNLLQGDPEADAAVKREIAARKELITLIGGKDARDASAKAAKDAENEWLRTSRQIEQSLTDALMRGFEGGKGFAENLRDTVSNTFKTMVLRPVVQAAVQPISSFVTNAVGATGINAVGASIGNSIGTSIAGSAIGSAIVGGLSNFGAGLSVTMANGLVSGFGTNMAVAGANIAQGSFSTALGVAAPYLLSATAIYSIAKSLDHSGTMHIGGSAQYSAAGGIQTALQSGLYGVGVGSDPGTYSKTTEAFASQLTQSIVGILDTTAVTFGKQAGFSAAAAFADDSSKDGAWGALAIKLGDQLVAGFGADGNGKWPGQGFADGQAGTEQYLAAVTADVRKALDAVGLPAWATSMLDKLGAAPSLEQLSQAVAQINEIQAALGNMGKAMPQIANLTDAAIQTLLTAFGGIQGLSQSVGSYYENFYSEAERNAQATDQVTKALAGLGYAMPTTREAFRQLVQAQDLTTEAGQAAYAQLLKLAPTFAALVPAAQEVGQAVDNTAAAMQKAAEAMAEAGRRSLSGLADDKGGLMVDLLKAQGDAAGAAALARQQALAKLTEGVSDVDKAAILAAYDYNQALRDQIAALQAASTAADQAAASQRQAEADAKAKAEAITAEAYGLTTQILQLEGDTTELRRRELEQLDPANRALQKRIYALQDQKAAESAAAQAADAIAKAQAQAASDAQRAAEEQQRAAEQIAQAWRSAADSVLDEVSRIRGLVSDSSGDSFAQAQARLAIAQAQAGAGDLEAFKKLPSLSQSMLSLAEQQAVSLAELQSLRTRTAASLERTANGGLGGYTAEQPVASYTATAPTVTIQPAAVPTTVTFSNSSSQDSLLEQIKTLTAEVTELRKQMDTSNVNTGRAAEALEGKQSVPFLVEIAP